MNTLYTPANDSGFQFVKKSGNAKTGPISTTSQPRSTCPSTCPHLGTSCYAQAGYYTRLNWNHLDNGTRGGTWADMVASIAKHASSVWRMSIMGDIPANSGTINRDAMQDIVNANGGRNGFTYTHHALTARNVATIKQSIRDGFTVNVSCDTLEEVKAADDAGLPSVLVCGKDTEKGKHELGNGITGVTCPAIFSESVTCSSCKLCADSERDYTIMFPAHGTQAKKIIPIKLAS